MAQRDRRGVEALPKVPFAPPHQLPFEFEIVPTRRIFAHSAKEVNPQKPHRAEFLQIIRVIEGSGEHIVDFDQVPVQNGDMLFIHESRVHQFVNPGAWQGRLYVFTRLFLYSTPEDLAVFENYRIFNATVPVPVLRVPASESLSFSRTFDELEAEFSRLPGDALSSGIIRSLLRALLLKAERLHGTRSPPAEPAVEIQFNRFRRLVEAQFMRNRNVQQYCFELGINAKRLNQITQQIVKKGSKEFIDDRAILEIKRLLAHTDIPVTQISDCLGFDEPTNLVKFFRRLAGKTPLEFREETRR